MMVDEPNEKKQFPSTFSSLIEQERTHLFPKLYNNKNNNGGFPIGFRALFSEMIDMSAYVIGTQLSHSMSTILMNERRRHKKRAERSISFQTRSSLEQSTALYVTCLQKFHRDVEKALIMDNQNIELPDCKHSPDATSLSEYPPLSECPTQPGETVMLDDDIIRSNMIDGNHTSLTLTFTSICNNALSAQSDEIRMESSSALTSHLFQNQNQKCCQFDEQMLTNCAQRLCASFELASHKFSVVINEKLR